MMELFRNKYREYMKNVDERTWNIIKDVAEKSKKPIDKVILDNCISISRSEIHDYPKFQEELISTKMVKDVSRHGYEAIYKLTVKGYKEFCK